MQSVTFAKFAKFAVALYTAYVDADAGLAEINPLVVTKQGDVVALDAKINLDDNARPNRSRAWIQPFGFPLLDHGHRRLRRAAAFLAKECKL